MNLLEYYIGDDPYTSLLQIIIIILSIVILRYVYTDNKNIRSLKNDIKKLDKECPPCPACNCEPGLTKCPDCVCPDKNSDITNNTGPNFPMNGGIRCPEVTCPDVKCPSVDEIVNGMFPGRNNGITASGKYFNINANEEGTLLSAYSSYSNLRNDGDDMRMPNSTDLPDDTIDKMNMGDSVNSTNTPNTPPPLSSTKMDAITPGTGLFTDDSTTSAQMSTQSSDTISGSPISLPNSTDN